MLTGGADSEIQCSPDSDIQCSGALPRPFEKFSLDLNWRGKCGKTRAHPESRGKVFGMGNRAYQKKKSWGRRTLREEQYKANMQRNSLPESICRENLWDSTSRTHLLIFQD